MSGSCPSGVSSHNIIYMLTEVYKRKSQMLWTRGKTHKNWSAPQRGCSRNQWGLGQMDTLITESLSLVWEGRVMAGACSLESTITFF